MCEDAGAQKTVFPAISYFDFGKALYFTMCPGKFFFLFLSFQSYRISLTSSFCNFLLFVLRGKATEKATMMVAMMVGLLRFFDALTHLYRGCVRRSVGPSIRPSVCHAFSQMPTRRILRRVFGLVLATYAFRVYSAKNIFSSQRVICRHVAYWLPCMRSLSNAREGMKSIAFGREFIVFKASLCTSSTTHLCSLNP